METSTSLALDSSCKELELTNQPLGYWPHSTICQISHGETLAYESDLVVSESGGFPNIPSSLLSGDWCSTGLSGFHDSCGCGEQTAVDGIHEWSEIPSSDCAVGSGIDGFNTGSETHSIKDSLPPQVLTDNESRTWMQNFQNPPNPTFPQHPSRIEENNVLTGKETQYFNVQGARQREEGLVQSERKRHSQRRQIKEKNRAASSKSRVKKREDAMMLKSKEDDMQRINRELSSCVASLSRQLVELKTEVLLHAHCNYHPIQRYIWNEAQQFVQASYDHSQIDASCHDDYIPT